MKAPNTEQSKDVVVREVLPGNGITTGGSREGSKESANPPGTPPPPEEKPKEPMVDVPVVQITPEVFLDFFSRHQHLFLV